MPCRGSSKNIIFSAQEVKLWFTLGRGTASWAFHKRGASHREQPPLTRASIRRPPSACSPAARAHWCFPDLLELSFQQQGTSPDSLNSHGRSRCFGWRVRVAASSGRRALGGPFTHRHIWLLRAVIHCSRGDQMGRRPGRSRAAGEQRVNPGITFPVTSAAGVSRFPFARSLLRDGCPPRKPHEPWGTLNVFQREWDWSSGGEATQVEPSGKPHVLRMQRWDPGRVT